MSSFRLRALVVAASIAVAVPGFAFDVDAKAVAATIAAFKTKQPTSKALFFFQNKAAYDRFSEGKMEFGARANAVFLEKGVSGEPPYVDGVLILAQTKAGLMADASVGGQKFTFEKL